MSAVERIVKLGRIVLFHHWDSGGPGIGAGVELVFSHDGKFAVHSEDDGSFGPFDSLTEAIEQTDVLGLTEASTRIEGESLAVIQILDLLKMYCDGDQPLLDVNGTTCEFDSDAEHYRPREVDRPRVPN
ncbi:MAG: hypothetical protein P1U77_29180 [Rubripirellula sp.]|nr:hypothetical protein [Rubripirellula sp.]